MSLHHLPSRAAAPVVAWGRPEREMVRLERRASREVFADRVAGRVMEERARVQVRVVGEVAREALDIGFAVTQRAANLATACPDSAPLMRSIVEEAGRALGDVVRDTAHQVRG